MKLPKKILKKPIRKQEVSKINKSIKQIKKAIEAPKFSNRELNLLMIGSVIYFIYLYSEKDVLNFPSYVFYSIYLSSAIIIIIYNRSKYVFLKGALFLMEFGISLVMSYFATILLVSFLNLFIIYNSKNNEIGFFYSKIEGINTSFSSSGMHFVFKEESYYRNIDNEFKYKLERSKSKFLIIKVRPSYFGSYCIESISIVPNN